MKSKFKGLILALILVFGLAVPAAAATGSYKFEYNATSLQTGKSKVLYIYDNGKKISAGKFQWKSSDPKTVSVSNGKITAKKSGRVQICAVASGKKIRCNVFAYRQDVKTNFVGYKSTSTKIKAGSSIRLKPEKQGTVTGYRSSDPKIATITSSGILTAKKSGTAVISCASYGTDRYIASIRITVAPELKSVSIPDELVMDKGGQKNLTVTVRPGNAYIKSITYTSSNNSIATVSKTGKITAKSAGLAKISVTVDGGIRIKKTLQLYVQNKATENGDKPLNGTAGRIVHRGLSLEAPENSLPAFRLAAQKGAQYIETDVRMLKDGTFVIFHDSSLQRMCGVNKKIEDLTYQEVKKYPIITGTNASLYKNNVIPTLEQYLQCCNQYSVTPVIEIKSQLDQTGVARFNKIIKMSQKSTVVISFKEEPLKMLRQINRTVSIQWILRERITEAALDECYRYKFDVSAQYGCTSRITIRKAHSRNIKVALWLFTDSGIADCYKNWGVDYLTCDRVM